MNENGKWKNREEKKNRNKNDMVDAKYITTTTTTMSS